MPPTPVLYLVRAHFIRFPEFDKSTQGLFAVRSSNGVGKGSSKSDDDDDTEVAGVPPVSALLWEDADLRCQTLNALNHMRRNRHFCDVTLQVNEMKLSRKNQSQYCMFIDPVCEVWICFAIFCLQTMGRE